ncbi:TPA: hypothetical protein JDL67_000791 [Salmonella enterica subsp. salamae]|nr:hypothetical protein [Salmonella enterica subsp. salamae]
MKKVLMLLAVMLLSACDVNDADGVKASKYFYRVTFKPSVIVPDITIQ